VDLHASTVEVNSEPMRQHSSGHDYICRREGDYWTFAFEGAIVRTRDTRGVRYLAALLRHPGAPVHVNAVMKAAGVSSGTAKTGARHADALAERARISVTKGTGVALARLEAMHPLLGEHLRATIRRGYYCAYRPDPRLAVVWRE
jgi:hypothetical protein